jgi:hypothetical protein
LSDSNDIRLPLRVTVKHLKYTEYGEAGEKGKFMNKCRAKKTYWVTIGVCSIDSSSRTLSFSKWVVILKWQSVAL